MTNAEGYKGLKVIGARLVVKLDEESNVTQSGIVIVQDTKEPKYEGTVVAVGTGARLENGTKMPMEVNVGDRIIYSRMAGIPVEHEGEKLLIINERDVSAILG